MRGCRAAAVRLRVAAMRLRGATNAPSRSLLGLDVRIGAYRDATAAGWRRRPLAGRIGQSIRQGVGRETLSFAHNRETPRKRVGWPIYFYVAEVIDRDTVAHANLPDAPFLPAAACAVQRLAFLDNFFFLFV